MHNIHSPTPLEFSLALKQKKMSTATGVLNSRTHVIKTRFQLNQGDASDFIKGEGGQERWSTPIACLV